MKKTLMTKNKRRFPREERPVPVIKDGCFIYTGNPDELNFGSYIWSPQIERLLRG